jgi:hypothetical protein
MAAMLLQVLSFDRNFLPWLRSLVAGLSPRRSGFAAGQSMWDLWWTKWHWDRFFSKFLSIRVVSDYGLDDRAIGVRSPVDAKDFSCNLCVQTSSEAHPAFCPMGIAEQGQSAAGA